MERPPKIYFCNKCGYVGISDTHPGCQYLAYPMANPEQLYIDHLEAELAALRASPASVPEGWKSLTDVQWMNIVNLNHAWANVDKEDAINEVVKLVEAKCKANNLAAAPTPPVSEDRKDAENSALKLARDALRIAQQRPDMPGIIDEALAAIDALGE